MPSIKVVDMAGKEVGSMELSEKVFAATVDASVLHSAVKVYLANQRQGTQSTLTRSEVSGGGKKPWKQKGTGRARQGSTRSPQWTHGGIALGPKPRSYRLTLNKKVRNMAMFGALSQKVAGSDMIVVNEIKTAEYKTKNMTAMLKALGAECKALIVLPEMDAAVIKSCANIPGVKTVQFNEINTYDIINADKVVIAEAAVKKIEEVYA